MYINDVKRQREFTSFLCLSYVCNSRMSPVIILSLCLVAIVSGNFMPEREYEVKQGGLFNSGRTYTITELASSSKNSTNAFTVKNDLLKIGKKMVLLDHGRPLYYIQHKLANLYQKWKIYDARTDEEVGTLKHRPSLIHDSYKFTSSKFGSYRITGEFGNRSFSIKKDGRQVAKILKKLLHVRDTYAVQIEAGQDPALMLLLTIGIDEIREH